MATKKPGNRISSAPGFRPRVVVKFRDSVQLPYLDGLEKYLEHLNIGPFEKLKKDFPRVHFTRMFTAAAPEGITKLVDRARSMDNEYQPPNFLTYFIAEAPGSNVEALLKELLSWDTVETAYLDTPASDPVVNSANDPRAVNQGYLNAAPDGVDARFAWTVTGGDGAGLRFIDLEQGWTLNHEDLTAHAASLLFGTLVNSSRPHGTSVLGEVCAVDNTVGCVGIAPNIASLRVVSHSGSLANVPSAIMAAITNLNFGDVLLLEVQTSPVNFPVETQVASFDAIRLATALGIVVVEAGANGSNNLDNFTDGGGHRVLDRTSGDFRDSGAIMVGAGSSLAPHARLGFSNFGNRVDCYGWGENVDTSSSDSGGTTNLYTALFSGTSSASPIVTGAALSVQGMAQASLGFRFSPRQLRAILSNTATGTLSNNPGVDRIGVMPNLRNIAVSVLGIAPDVYIRDFVGDVGDPHTGAISASPDIILLKATEPNPQMAFGEGSGAENSNLLGSEAEAGQDNFIYVRVRNRGGSNATNVTATVFWSPPSTLVTPNLWTLAGTINLPAVPSGNVLTVSNAITWPTAQIPATGHYCFVGLIGNAEDPAPAPADFLDWNNFQLFIRNNNNVTWRNFNVVDNDPSAGPDPEFVVAAFLVAGAPDQARPFRLESVARLPEGARVFLEAPQYLLAALRHPGAITKQDGKRGTARVPLSPHGAHEWGSALLPVGARIPVKLLVSIPKARRDAAYEVYVRQIFEQVEVGRITWRFAPKKSKGNGRVGR